MPDSVPGPRAEVAALLPALREAAEWAGAMVHRLGDAATAPGHDGGWTPVRIVVHLAAVDAEVWTPRFRQLAAHDHPTWVWTEPDLAGRADPSPDEAAEAFGGTRAALMAAFAAMSPGVDGGAGATDG